MNLIKDPPKIKLIRVPSEIWEALELEHMALREELIDHRKLSMNEFIVWVLEQYLRNKD